MQSLQGFDCREALCGRGPGKIRVWISIFRGCLRVRRHGNLSLAFFAHLCFSLLKFSSHDRVCNAKSTSQTDDSAQCLRCAPQHLALCAPKAIAPTRPWSPCSNYSSSFFHCATSKPALTPAQGHRCRTKKLTKPGFSGSIPWLHRDCFNPGTTTAAATTTTRGRRKCVKCRVWTRERRATKAGAGGGVGGGWWRGRGRVASSHTPHH